MSLIKATACVPNNFKQTTKITIYCILSLQPTTTLHLTQLVDRPEVELQLQSLELHRCAESVMCFGKDINVHSKVKMIYELSIVVHTGCPKKTLQATVAP